MVGFGEEKRCTNLGSFVCAYVCVLKKNTEMKFILKAHGHRGLV